MKNKRLASLIIGSAVLLSIPFVAMQITNEVNWSAFDFLIMAILLFGSSFLIDFVWKKAKTRNGRIFMSALVIIAFLLVWAELAVGIFNSPLAGN